jgi:hypothetical protein
MRLFSHSRETVSCEPMEVRVVTMLATNIRSTGNVDGGILMDVEQDAMIGLNTTASFICTGLRRGLSTTEIAQELADITGESFSIIEADVTEFIASMQSDNFLAQPSSRRISMRRLVWSAFWMLLKYDIVLIGSRIVGKKPFALNHKRVRQWPLYPSAPNSPDLATVCEAIRIARSWYLRQVLCLQDSLVTTCMLRNHGIPAEMVIATVTLPFNPHAWVEVGGKVVNDTDEHIAKFMVLDRC